MRFPKPFLKQGGLTKTPKKVMTITWILTGYFGVGELDETHIQEVIFFRRDDFS